MVELEKRRAGKVTGVRDRLYALRLLVGAMVVVAVSSRAIADPARDRVVVATTDEAFRGELADALGPSDFSLVVVDEPIPTLADVTRISRGLADREHATAAVWLVASPNGSTLVTYDRGVDRVLVRTIAFAPPLSPAQGAEAARMARTMLRALRVTPDINLPPPHPDEARAIRASAAAFAIAPHRGPALIGVVLGVGVHVHPPGAGAAAAGSAMVIWRPDELGVAIAGDYAPSSSFATSTFTGAAHDDSVALLARWPVALASFRLVALAGPALHITGLRGQASDGEMPAITHVDPAVRGQVIGAYALDRTVDVGVAVAGDYVADRQRYSFDASEVLAIPRFQVLAELVLTLAVR
jgi:hypothetical protein